jgi:uncharacterized OB-fold protein
MSERGFTAASFEAYLEGHRLMGSRCLSCETLHLPPRALCPQCHSVDMKWEEMSGRGRLAAFTAVHIAPTAMIQAGYDRKNPYCAGIVQLEEGPSVSAQILGLEATEPARIAIGTELRVSFVRRGEGDEERTVLAFERAG